MLDWIFALAIVTFLCVVGFLVWSKKRTPHHARQPSAADPQSETGHQIRPPEELRAALDAAAGDTPRSVGAPVAVASESH